MRVVIAGGTGLIGRLLVNSLVNDKHEVTLLSRNPNRSRKDLPTAVKMAQWDGKSVGDWTQFIEKADILVNFAGENLAGEGFFPERWTDEKKRRIRESRLNSGRAIVEALKQIEKKPPVLLQSSAIGYYGIRGDEIVTETTPPLSDFLAEVAVEWEATTSEAESLGVRRIVVRTGLILTSEGGPLTRLLPFYKLYGGNYFGNGKQWWSWIHWLDEIRALRFLMEHESAAGPFNLTAPNPVTNREFGKALGKAMNRPSYVPVPAFAMKLMMGEVATVVLDGQRAIPEKLEELGFAFRFPEVTGALSDILDS